MKLNTEATVYGSVSNKGTTKNYTDATGKTVTANVVTFAYTGLTLSRGNLTGSLPSFVTTANVAYVLDNNTLYVSKGRRQADGLGDALSRDAIKQ